MSCSFRILNFFVKFIAKHFLLFDVTVNKIVSWILLFIAAVKKRYWLLYIGLVFYSLAEPILIALKYITLESSLSRISLSISLYISISIYLLSIHDVKETADAIKTNSHIHEEKLDLWIVIVNKHKKESHFEGTFQYQYY